MANDSWCIHCGGNGTLLWYDDDEKIVEDHCHSCGGKGFGKIYTKPITTKTDALKIAIKALKEKLEACKKS